MEELSYLLLALIITLLVWVMWKVATFKNENLVTNNPQLISTYHDNFQKSTSYADHIKLPFMYF